MKFGGYCVSPNLDVRMWHGDYILLAPINVYNAAGDTVLTVPTGFKTDLASIPAVFRGIAPKVGKGLMRPAVVHDYLYRTDKPAWSQKDSDQLFLALMKSGGASWVRRTNRYRMVRMFGKSSFRKNRRSGAPAFITF